MRQREWCIRIGTVAAFAFACFQHEAAAAPLPAVAEASPASRALPARLSQTKERAVAQPPTQPFALTESDKLILQGVNFHAGTAEIIHASKLALTVALKVLTENPQARVQIAGHTDSTGSDADKQRLSEQRAQAVKAALVQGGIDAARLETIGYGASRPLTHSRTPAGRAMNRRVTLTIIDSHTDTRGSQKAREPGQTSR